MRAPTASESSLSFLHGLPCFGFLRQLMMSPLFLSKALHWGQDRQAQHLSAAQLNLYDEKVNSEMKTIKNETNWPGVISHEASLLFSETGPFRTYPRMLQLQIQWPRLSLLKCLPPVDLVDDVHLCLTRHPALKKGEKITDHDVNSEQTCHLSRRAQLWLKHILKMCLS